MGSMIPSPASAAQDAPASVSLPIQSAPLITHRARLFSAPGDGGVRVCCGMLPAFGNPLSALTSCLCHDHLPRAAACPVEHPPSVDGLCPCMSAVRACAYSALDAILCGRGGCSSSTRGSS